MFRYTSQNGASNYGVSFQQDEPTTCSPTRMGRLGQVLELAIVTVFIKG